MVVICEKPTGECASATGCAQGTLELPVTPEGICSTIQNPSSNTEFGLFYILWCAPLPVGEVVWFGILTKVAFSCKY